MAIDSRVKRASIAGIALPFMLGVTANTSKPQAWRQAAGNGYSGILAAAAATAPADDDTKNNDGTTLTVTSVSDCDGANIRPPRLTFRRAVDSGRNADLSGSFRADMDRRFVRYKPPVRNKGLRTRIVATSNRAGDALGVSRIVVYGTRSNPDVKRDVTDTTSRTDCNGAFIRVPELRVAHAADSAQNADLTYGATDRDRVRVRLPVHSSIRAGYRHRLLIQSDCRAGNALGIMRITVWGTRGPETPARARIT